MCYLCVENKHLKPCNCQCRFTMINVVEKPAKFLLDNQEENTYVHCQDCNHYLVFYNAKNTVQSLTKQINNELKTELDEARYRYAMKENVN